MSQFSLGDIDDFVYEYFGEDTGYFVDIGANDGIHGSHTYTLELRGWDGICVEPLQMNFDVLISKRKCILENKWLASSIREERAIIPCKKESHMVWCHAHNGGSCFVNYISNNHRESLLERGNIETDIVTDTLQNILLKHNAPYRIELLQIDTEGSELDVLMGVDLDMFDFRMIIVEDPDQKQDIPKYLSKYSYKVLKHIHMDTIYIKR